MFTKLLLNKKKEKKLTPSQLVIDFLLRNFSSHPRADVGLINKFSKYRIIYQLQSFFFFSIDRPFSSRAFNSPVCQTRETLRNIKSSLVCFEKWVASTLVHYTFYKCLPEEMVKPTCSNTSWQRLRIRYRHKFQNSIQKLIKISTPWLRSHVCNKC